MKNLILSGLILLGSYSNAHAKLLHIIHTNDLHSMFDGTRDGKGGYARLKTIVDALRAESKAKKVPSLYLDAGDFGEGSSFYFSNKGVDSIRALDLLGVDVSVMGNHDYILGGRDFARQMREANLKAKMLSANLMGKRFLGLKKLLPSHFDWNLDGLKVRIIGLSTAEIHYQYPLRPLGHIKSSIKTGMKLEKKAQKENVDFLIALTHIGVRKDVELVQRTSAIDLVIGGHSHTYIPKPEMTLNKEGREIAIVQAGAHGLHVGSLWIDVQPDGKSTIINYRMYDITKDIAKNTVLKDFVAQAEVNRENYFERKWDEVIGFTDIPLNGYVDGHASNNRGCWSQHMARLTRQAARADIGFQFEDFQGERIAPGPVTFGDMVDNFPHFRKWNDAGWKIKKAWVQGFVLKKLIKIVANTEYASLVTVDGLQADRGDEKGLANFDLLKDHVDTAMINGRPMNSLKYYTVALPSEVPHALTRTFNILGYVVFNLLYTVRGSEYWPLIEDYIKENSPIRCIDESELIDS